MSAADTLRQHLAELSEASGVTGKVVEADGRLYVVLDRVPLPKGVFQLEQTDVLFIADPQYPLSAIDMFWTDVGLVRPDGSAPQGAEVIETYLDRQWRRFSWHRQGVWNSAGNPLLDHYAFMEARWTLEPGREAA